MRAAKELLPAASLTQNTTCHKHVRFHAKLGSLHPLPQPRNLPLFNMMRLQHSQIRDNVECQDTEWTFYGVQGSRTLRSITSGNSALYFCIPQARVCNASSLEGSLLRCLSHVQSKWCAWDNIEAYFSSCLAQRLKRLALPEVIMQAAAAPAH